MLDSDLLNYIEIRSQKTNRCNEVPAKSVTCMFKKKVLYLFKVKRTTNSTYTKEEVGCESSSCSTTIHDNGDGKRICCTTSDCNKDTTAFNTQSNAPSLSYTIAIIFSFFTLCLNIFWNLALIWYIPPLFSFQAFSCFSEFRFEIISFTDIQTIFKNKYCFTKLTQVINQLK